MSSYTSSPKHFNDYDFDNDEFDYNSASDFDDDRDLDGNVSDEDTEDASETEEKTQTGNRTEIKEQMYQDKLAQLKKQLQALQEGTLPEYIKRLKKIDQQYKERLRLNELWRDIELEVVERDYHKEKKESVKEFEEKKVELKETLVMELKEKKGNIETERQTMDLNNGDFMEMKPIMTRKLRRRPNDPMPMPEKRRKPSPATLNFALDEAEIAEDMRILNKVSGKPLAKKLPPVPTPVVDMNLDVKIEDGKLYYDKRWFTRNQPIMLESKEGGKVMGSIINISAQEILVRRATDNGKIRIYISQLQKGRYILHHRSS
ncbi:sin3 histone deacetylase corepressor complex component SDS3-like isoform X2 [Pomacea canaliculata]|uniref:sin3 histone deacetylase corepressor complex component SDS3-like isoform X2 n=1 Tax=Pomacea canaliculata TaxID=400727 RepID=UPI000D729B76|nr:sin3 histone deacetylase corepressor complex component SDS3-like isoform X2 [Pomacea canaliculata]